MEILTPNVRKINIYPPLPDPISSGHSVNISIAMVFPKNVSSRSLGYGLTYSATMVTMTTPASPLPQDRARVLLTVGG